MVLNDYLFVIILILYSIYKVIFRNIIKNKENQSDRTVKDLYCYLISTNIERYIWSGVLDFYCFNTTSFLSTLKFNVVYWILGNEIFDNANKIS